MSHSTHHTWTSPAGLTALAAGMLGLAIYGSLLPFEYQARPLADAAAAFANITLHDPTELGARGDWVVSVVLYLALGFLLMAGLCVDGPPRRSWRAAPAVALLIAALSVAVEFAQLYFPPRTVSLNDIIAETAGGAIGTILWVAFGQRIIGWIRRVLTPTGVTALAGRLLPGYIVLLLIVELMPFDFTLSPAELTRKFEEGKVWLVPFTRPPEFGWVSLYLKSAINIGCFFPLGLLPAIASHPPGTPIKRTRWLNLFVAGLAAACLIEVLQLLVYSRIFDATDMVTGALALVLGWHAGLWALNSWRNALAQADPFANPFGPAQSLVRPAILVALGLAWFAAVLYLNWTPFNFTTDPVKLDHGPDDFAVWGLRRMTWLPFVDYYWGSKYQALDQFAKKLVSFFPLGVLCALAARRLFRSRAVLTAMGLALAAALTIEIGRYFIPSHNASVTDLLLQCAGAWVGYRVTQYVRAVYWAEKALYGYLYQQVQRPHRPMQATSPNLFS